MAEILLPGILELLSSLGVLDTETPSAPESTEDNEMGAASFGMASRPGPDPKLVGLLPGIEIQDPNRDGDPLPKYQPPLFWKALAFAIADSSCK